MAALANGEEEVSLTVEHESGSEMYVAGSIESRRRLEQHLLIDEVSVAQPSAYDLRHRRVVFTGIAEGQIDPPVFGVLGVNGDVEETP
jgi:hypothetical protein